MVKGMLNDMHKHKIDMADEIFVINENGCIDERIWADIEYARANEKLVKYLEPCDYVDEIIMDKVIEAEKEYQERVINRPLCASVDTREDFNSLNEITNRVFIHGPEDIEFPDCFEFSELRHISMYPIKSWDDIAEIDFAWIESLHITVPDEQEPRAIDAYYLEELYIAFQETDEDSIQMPDAFALDFSGTPDLESLTLLYPINIRLDNFEGLKKLKYLRIKNAYREHLCLSLPESLETLIIEGEYWDISLTTPQRCLKKLSLYNTQISDLEWIRDLENLESLEINGGDIRDITPLLSLSKLKYVSIKNNPITNTGGIEKNDNIETLLSVRDYDLAYLRGCCDFNFYRYVTMIHAQDDQREEKIKKRQELSKSPVVMSLLSDTSLSDTIRKDLIELTKDGQKSKGDRIKEYMQMDFEKCFEKIVPSNHYIKNYSEEYKQLYVDYVLAKYPFLKVTPHMQAQLIQI